MLLARRAATVALVALLAVLGACGDDPDTPEAPVDRSAAVYARAVRVAVAGTGAERDAPVFVAGADDEVIDLEVQVGTIQRLDDVLDVRFVDRREEALDLERRGDPVRGDGVLVTLGPVVAGEGTAELHVERYVREGQEEAWVMTLRRDDDGWAVVGEEPASPWPRVDEEG